MAPPAPSSNAGADAGPGPAYCLQTHAQSLPARLVAMSASAVTSNVVLVSDLFQRFIGVCGSCHGPAVDPPGQGGFQIVRSSDFASLMTASVLRHVTDAVCPSAPSPASPDDAMPPCSSPNGGTYAQRPQEDSVRQLGDLLQQWLAAGSPNAFTPASASPGGDAGGAADAGGVSPFVMTPQTGNAMTNLGNCVPSPGLMGVLESQAAALDAKFAAMTAKKSGTAADIIGLPEHLGDTDLVTLDSATLAQYGVIAYAPGYPLWSDNAGKLRHVRVPRGQSIHFDKTTQQFQIPPNTRFYKTFMKQIVDTDGSYRYRKIETRLIVSRPDQNNSDGTVTQTALFGTYRWNDSESDAALVDTPLNDGLPFADTVLLYNTDEQLAAAILSTHPAAPETQLLNNHAARHYAIPSSQRCIQCHMGSPSQSFVLGFTPLQINRRPVGVGGVIEPTGPDELTQLQRLIDAGVVTGITTASDVLPLEQSQGGRTPRNAYELTAQGYVLGNCSHCHNPRGFPTVQNPVLNGVLDFLPSATGGIFQFPLDRFSPRVGRGLTGTTSIPYITPSLVDLPKLDPQSGGQAPDWFIQAVEASDVVWVDYAPWRSLIYRNVDSVFAYTDDFALFPHMPMNTPGYDPRAKQILSDWMVSIPAVRKHPDLVEYAYQIDNQASDNVGSPVVDTEPQPYVEVLPGDPGYDAAVSAAERRLDVLHGKTSPVKYGPSAMLDAGGALYSRYDDPGQTDDIIDPLVVEDPICHPIPAGDPTTGKTPLAEHPHWVSTDLTQVPGAWAPRQPNWPDVLVAQHPPPPNSGCSGVEGEAAAYEDQLQAIAMLPDVTFDQAAPGQPSLRDFATTSVPFGLWQKQPGCNFSSQPTAGSFTGAQRPHWLDVVNPPPDAPVFQQTPGAAVFKIICINCHGPRADSNGRLAQNLATMTGGNALVADFRDGLFGPVGASADASNRHAVYSVPALLAALPSGDPPPSAKWTDPSVTDDDRAARYMAWMGLGGTSVNIPIAVLEVVSITKVLDQVRTLNATQLSANMLSEAKALCMGLLGPGYSDASSAVFNAIDGQGYLDAKPDHINRTLIPTNGDAELWLKLCSLNNPPPVHIFSAKRYGTSFSVPAIQDYQYNFSITAGTLIENSAYPAGVPVGNERGGVDTALQPGNEWPWCVDDSAAPPDQAALIAQSLPVCPPSVITAIQQCSTGTAGCITTSDANRWAVRGAINAGFSVYQYVSSIESSTPPPDYNQCTLLH